MGAVALFKSGLVGGLGFIIAIVAVIALLTFASQSLESTNIKNKVHKLPSWITLVIVWGIGWGIAYWYFSTITGVGVNAPHDEVVLTAFACLFTLTPSFAIVCAASAYYLAVQKVMNTVKANKVNLD